MSKKYTYYGFEYADKWDMVKTDKEVLELIEQTIDEKDIEELEEMLIGSEYVIDKKLSKEELKASLLEQHEKYNSLDDWFSEYIYEIVREEAEEEYRGMVNNG